jgi:hypothetical protein
LRVSLISCEIKLPLTVELSTIDWSQIEKNRPQLQLHLPILADNLYLLKSVFQYENLLNVEDDDTNDDDEDCSTKRICMFEKN